MPEDAALLADVAGRRRLLACARRAGDLRPDLLRAADEPQNWLTYSGGYASQRHSLLKQIDPGNVEESRAEMDPAQPGVRRVAVHAARRERDHVRDAASERRAGASTRRPAACSGSTATPCRPTRACAAAPTTAASPSSATRSTWARSTAHLVALDATTGRPLWNVDGRRSQARLLDHDGAAHRQGQGARRRRRRRVRHPRLRRGVRRARRARKSGASTPSRRPASPATRRGAATRGRPAAARCG